VLEIAVSLTDAAATIESRILDAVIGEWRELSQLFVCLSVRLSLATLSLISRPILPRNSSTFIGHVALSAKVRFLNFLPPSSISLEMTSMQLFEHLFELRPPWLCVIDILNVEWLAKNRVCIRLWLGIGDEHGYFGMFPLVESHAGSG